MPYVMEVVYARVAIFEKGRLRTIDDNIPILRLFKNDLGMTYFFYAEWLISIFLLDNQNTLLEHQRIEKSLFEYTSFTERLLLNVLIL